MTHLEMLIFVCITMHGGKGPFVESISRKNWRRNNIDSEYGRHHEFVRR